VKSLPLDLSIAVGRELLRHLDVGDWRGFGVGWGLTGFCGWVREDGHLPPQTIPHPLHDEAAQRMGHPDLWRVSGTWGGLAT
jgi:hypothetical protein